MHALRTHTAHIALLAAAFLGFASTAPGLAQQRTAVFLQQLVGRMTRLIVRRTSWRHLVREVLLPAACLVVGMNVTWLVVRQAAGVAAVSALVEVVGRVNQEMWERIGWTLVILLPLALWLLALCVATCLRALGARASRSHLSRQLETIKELAPMVGMVGTISGLAEATGSMNADNVEASLLSLAPAVGHALYSTMAGLGLAIVAYVLARLSDSPGGGGTARRTVVMLALASAIALASPPRAEAAQDLFSLPLAVGQTWDRAVASQRGARPPVVHTRESLRRLIHRVAVHEGLDPLFAEALARSESGLNPRAISINGCCRGLFQLHHVTARELGVHNVFDATENATGGIRYFRRLARRFGSVAVALVAYNAGPTVAQRWMVSPATTGVPSETMRFVDHVITTYRRLRVSPREAP